MTYTNEFLLLELHRFNNENDRVPTIYDMTSKNGYPSHETYRKRFKTWNNAIEKSGLKINSTKEKRTGTETCYKCGCNKNTTQGWHTKGLLKGQVMCKSCYQKSKSDYMNGNLDVNSNVGLGRASEICVAKTLKIKNEYDCNRILCGHKIDLYHSDKYKKIDVKVALLGYEYNNWRFNFNSKKVADNYICLGLSPDRKNVNYVWIIPNIDEIRDRQTFSITNTQKVLLYRKNYEINATPYDDTWKEMLVNYFNGECKIFR